MRVTFVGGAKTVTGSCFYIEANNLRFLVDCGMFQGHEGSKSLNFEPFPFEVKAIDYVFLTHCHIDHSGRIPKLYKEGFKGKIYATKATVELCSIMLPDSGHIQEFEHEWINRKRVRAGKDPIDPLYTYDEAVESLVAFEKTTYDKIIEIGTNLKIRFTDAGHILGSSILEIWIDENGKETKLVFSGDLGNTDLPILRDPSIIEEADYLFLESTYGDRLHKNEAIDKATKITDVILDTIENGGNVIIPSFAVGRTQEIIYDLNKKLGADNKLKKLLNIPVYVDSPLATSATEIFRNNLDCYDEEAREYIKNGDNPLDFPTLKFTKSANDSKELNFKKENMIIISASGMCDAGRIKHHLKHNLWKPEATVLFVGYQAQGTLGRRLVEGEKKVRIFGESITVNAKIEVVEGYSGHADQQGLLNWLESFKKKPSKVFIIHGEGERQEILSDLINQKFGLECIIPDRGESYNITKEKPAYKENKKEELTYNYSRLQLLEYANILEEEMLDITEIIKEYAMNEKEKDNNISILLNKAKEIEEKLRTYFENYPS